MLTPLQRWAMLLRRYDKFVPLIEQPLENARTNRPYAPYAVGGRHTA
jgi:hypothetical protein